MNFQFDKYFHWPTSTGWKEVQVHLDFFCTHFWPRLSSALCNTVFKVEKHFQKSFQALCFQITYFICDLDNYQEFAKTGAVILYDLLFYLNENLEYVEAEFQMDNNSHYAKQ